MTASKSTKSTREKLLHSAADLFSEKGYASTSVAEICARAGANIAAVNYHFQSKDNLYRCVIEYTFEQAERAHPMDFTHCKDDEEKLYAFVLGLLKRILNKKSHGNFYQLLTKEMAEPTAASGTLISDAILRKRRILKEIISALYGKDIDEDLLLQMAHSIVSQCLFYGMHEKGRKHHLKGKQPALSDAESFARHITIFSLAGITGYKKQDGAAQDSRPLDK